MSIESRIEVAEHSALLAALRAVLDLCDSTPLRFRPYDGAEPFMVLGVPAIRAEIAAALGEESWPAWSTPSNKPLGGQA